MSIAKDVSLPVPGPSCLRETLPDVYPTQVSRDVFVLHPEAEGLGTPDDPRLIMLFSWMDARPKSVLTYMSKYRALFPGATQIMVLSRQSATWSSEETNLNSVRPVVDVLKSIGFFGSEPPSVLVHAFSNGGGQQMLLLSSLLRQVPTEIDGRPLKGTGCLIFDSLPGNGKLRTAIRAHTASLQHHAYKVIAAIPLTIIWCLIMGSSRIMGRLDPITALRIGLNDPSVLPWTSEKTPRVYIYGTDDRIIPSYAIEEHISEAKEEKGLAVTEEPFEGSNHVAHVRTDPNRYWVIVKDTWQQALKTRAAL